MVKFNDVSKNVISVMSAKKVYDYTVAWAKDYDKELYELLTRDEEFSVNILNIDREGPKPRKDIACFSEIKDYISYFFDELYEKNYELPENITKEMAAEILDSYLKEYSAADDKQQWFDRIKALCEPLGYTPNVKDYKKNP